MFSLRSILLVLHYIIHKFMLLQVILASIRRLLGILGKGANLILGDLSFYRILIGIFYILLSYILVYSLNIYLLLLVLLILGRKIFKHFEIFFISIRIQLAILIPRLLLVYYCTIPASCSLLILWGYSSEPMVSVIQIIDPGNCSREGGTGGYTKYIFNYYTLDKLEIYAWIYQTELCTISTPADLLKETVHRSRATLRLFKPETIAPKEIGGEFKNLDQVRDFMEKDLEIYFPKRFLYCTSRPSVDIVIKYCTGMSLQDFIVSKRNILIKELVCDIGEILGKFNSYSPSVIFSKEGLDSIISLFKLVINFSYDFRPRMKELMEKDIIKFNEEILLRCFVYWERNVGLIPFKDFKSPGCYIGEGFHGIGKYVAHAHYNFFMGADKYPEFKQGTAYGRNLIVELYSNTYYTWESSENPSIKKDSPVLKPWDEKFPNINLFKISPRDAIIYYSPKIPYISTAMELLKDFHDTPGVTPENFIEQCRKFRLGYMKAIKEEDASIENFHKKLLENDAYINIELREKLYDKFKIFYFDE